MGTALGTHGNGDSPATGPARRETIFYDGDCGVCHWAVGFVARRDPDGLTFRFAPLGGESFLAAVDEKARLNLPDSMVVHTEEGRLLLRSDGALHILRRLGGAWRILAVLLAVLPRTLRDVGYDLFARIRHRLVKTPEGVCPVLPPELRARFDP